MDRHFVKRPENPSYLCARDPSIVAWSRSNMDVVRTDLKDEFSSDNSPVITEKKEEHLEVYLRLKAGIQFEDLYEVSENETLICHVPEGSHALRNMKDGMVTRKYSFSKIFGPTFSQIDIFNYIVKPRVLNFINGHNSTLLTYGASGSGKTFTIVGTANEPGMVPRALEYVFRSLPKLPSAPEVKPSPNGNVVVLDDNMRTEEYRNRRELLIEAGKMVDHQKHVKVYKAMQNRLSNEPAAIIDEFSAVSIGVWVSFAEIYNESIYDLLREDPPRGRQRSKLRLGTSNNNTYIKNLRQINVTSGLEAFQILQYGVHNLNYAATRINSHSSRSHSIFTVTFVQAFRNNTRISHFNFCDLAGSERLKKTLNEGDRLRESNNINTSLMVLGKCIAQVRDSQKQNDNRLIAFRESKLTQLFQNALSGYESISMIVNVNPSKEMFDETQHVLNFSAIAKSIIVEEKKPIVSHNNNRFSLYLHNKANLAETQVPTELQADLEYYKNMVSQLTDLLEEQRLEFEQNNSDDRNHIIKGYKEIIEMNDNMWKSQLKDSEEQVLRYKIALKNLKQKYEDERNKEKAVHTIVISDSSSEDEEEDKKKLIKSLKEENKKLEEKLSALELSSKIEINNLQRQVEGLSSKTKLLTQELQSKNQKISALQLTLQDAEISYKNLVIAQEQASKKSQHLQAELLEEHEKVLTLEYQLSETTNNLTVKDDIIEELEDFKDMYLRLKGAESTASESTFFKTPLDATFNRKSVRNEVSSTFSGARDSTSCNEDTLTDITSHSLSLQNIECMQSQEESSKKLNSHSPFLCKSTTCDFDKDN